MHEERCKNLIFFEVQQVFHLDVDVVHAAQTTNVMFGPVTDVLAIDVVIGNIILGLGSLVLDLINKGLAFQPTPTWGRK